MRITDLYGKHQGQPIYIVGTGPSMRVFPLNYLKGKITIGLNQAWKYIQPTYSITVHPELYLEWKKAKGPATQWVIKKKPPMENLSFDDPNHYVFATAKPYPNPKALIDRPEDVLFLALGIQCTAMDLAARMGARSIILVGCDMGDLGGEHHGHAQHVRWLGVAPPDVYKEYRYWTAKTRKILREQFGVMTVSLTPFLGVRHAEEDWQRLYKEFGLTKLPLPEDISPYKRTRTTLPE